MSRLAPSDPPAYQSVVMQDDSRTRRRSATIVLIAAGAVAVAIASGKRVPVPAAVQNEVMARAELRSWIVAWRGRHLYLEIIAPPGHESLSGRVEYTAAILRRDYRYTHDESGQPRVARMRGGNLRPPTFAGPPDDRLEAVYEITLEQARCLQRDRVFSEPYMLVGANSNAGLRRAMEECGLRLPERLLTGAGLFGEFPGIDQSVGDEIPSRWWALHGIGGDAAAVSNQR